MEQAQEKTLPPTRDQLKDLLKARMTNHKLSRASHKVKEEKLDKIKEELNKILEPTGVKAEDFIKKMASQNMKQFK